MGKTFDDLFNEFFNRGKNNKKEEKKLSSDKKEKNDDYIQNIIKLLSEFNDVDGENHEMMDNIDENLGEPDEVTFYEKDGMYFEERVWEDEEKRIIKTTVSDVPFKKESKKTLEEQLKEAVENEEYELAAELRDKITKTQKKEKKVAKKA